MNSNGSNTISLTISSSEEKEIRKDFLSYQTENPSVYIAFFAKKEGLSVSIYKVNKKGKTIVVFQGNNAQKAAQKYQSLEKREPLYQNHYPQIGSDEVGTGDFFGPVCVCAAYLEEKNLPRIEELGITDSKKMNDEYILKIGPTLIQEFEYSQLSLPNSRFNEIHGQINMNAIKAKMHNRCLLNLYEKHPSSFIYQDQFAESSLYFSYLKNEEKVVKNIIFHTKGESLFPAVALGSVIARYSFLRKIECMNEKYGLSFPLGAGKDVDSFIPYFVDKFGEKELGNVAKLSWANYKKWKETH